VDPFWKAAQKLKIKDPLFSHLLGYVKQSSMIELRDTAIDLHDATYGQWRPWNFKCWHDGMTK